MASVNPSEDYCDYPHCGEDCTTVCPTISVSMRKIDLSRASKPIADQMNDSIYEGRLYFDLSHYPMD